MIASRALTVFSMPSQRVLVRGEICIELGPAVVPAVDVDLEVLELGLQRTLLGEQLLVALGRRGGSGLLPPDEIVEALRLGLCARNFVLRGFMRYRGVRELRRDRGDPLVAGAAIFDEGGNLAILAREPLISGLQRERFRVRASPSAWRSWLRAPVTSSCSSAIRASRFLNSASMLSHLACRRVTSDSKCESQKATLTDSLFWTVASTVVPFSSAAAVPFSSAALLPFTSVATSAPAPRHRGGRGTRRSVGP